MKTAFFASTLGLMYVFLSLNVIRYRWKEKVSLGNGSGKDLEKAVRVHGNFIEYVPFALLLMFFLEILFGYEKLILGLGSMLLLGRIMHAIGLMKVHGASVGRSGGMVLTFSVIIISSLLILFRFFNQ
ncbi:MAG: MAPEG family protein [Bacteriovoracaceae bacterium]|nr:MAPEG family protein [Bacteriovoracaceae bacterium]